ncbi:MAG TPA: HEAT repeat domain-containing protein [Polyangiales bacterium]|nr:HEAT repeat domain-containing protein [Polyangiales bacterium]
MPNEARADDPRSAYLIKLLEGSSQFRVRAQAAISLGAVDPSPTVLGALGNALRDVHPAVRAAAANSLGRVGDKSLVPALRALDRDPEEPVRNAAKTALAKLEGAPSGGSVGPSPEPRPSGPAQYYVAVAQCASRVPGVEQSALSQARSSIQERVQQMDGVVIAPEGESSDAVERVLKKRNLRGYYIDCSIMSVEKKPDGGTRVAVSLILATYPGRDMRAIMQGAATVSGGGREDYAQAVQGAFSGALRQLPQALSR